MLPATRAVALLVLLGLAGCGELPATELRDLARSALDRGDYADATALCDRGLAVPEVHADEALHWFFVRTRLEALASQGLGAEVLDGVQAGFPPSLAPRLDAQQYARLANRLREGRDLQHAIELVHLGKQRFPDRAADFEDTLKSLEKAALEAAEGGDNAALEHLEQLGYLSRR